MAGDRARLDRIAPPRYDRFAHWPRGLARTTLASLIFLMLLTALGSGPAPIPVVRTLSAPASAQRPAAALQSSARPAAAGPDDNHDLQLYRTILARVRSGDGYYRAAVEEQRRDDYPVIPGLTVRLPTLAWLGAAVGDRGLTVLRLLLLAALLLAGWRRLAEVPGGPDRRPIALGLMVVGCAGVLGAAYDVFHEVWAAQLLALSFLLHRPERGQWRGAWLAAALGLAVRELVLPYVLLMAVLAAWHGRRGEALAWAGLIVLFLLGLAVHLQLVGAQVHPGDPTSPSWLAFKGIPGLVHKIRNSSVLVRLPAGMTGPFVVLALLGWAGWRTPLGLTGLLLSGGYALAFAIAGRDNNLYWGLVITPILFMGLAFVPIALPSLWRAARLRPAERWLNHA